MADMKHERLFHGLCRIGNFIYCTGGIDSRGFVNSCECYDIEQNYWSHNMPDLPDCVFNHTLLAVDRRWIYSFGGVSLLHDFMQVLRLDIKSINKPNSSAEWEFFIVPSIANKIDVGVIQLTSDSFLVFGGQKYRGSSSTQTYTFEVNGKNFVRSEFVEVYQPELILQSPTTFPMN